MIKVLLKIDTWNLEIILQLLSNSVINPNSQHDSDLACHCGSHVSMAGSATPPLKKNNLHVIVLKLGVDIQPPFLSIVLSRC